MPRKELCVPMDFSFPSEEERKAAMCVCCGSYCPSCEAPSDYAWRRRDVDLSNLLDDVIEKRLTEKEKETVSGFWFKGKTLTLMANEQGICASSVSRCLQNAQKKIYDALCYAVMYQHNILSDEFLPIAVRRAFSISQAKKYEPKTIGDRIRKLRCGENISEELLSESIGINIKSIKDIEKSKELPTLLQIIKLAGFFGTTTDYLLKGEK